MKNLINLKGGKPWTLNFVDVVKVLKGGAIAGAGAFLTYLSVEMVPYFEGASGWQAFLFTGFSSGINALRKLIADNS